MGEHENQHQEFSMGEAVTLRIRYIEVQQAYGKDHPSAVAVKQKIEDMNLKMTDQEIKDCWDRAIEESAVLADEDEELIEKYKNIEVEGTRSDIPVPNEAYDEAMAQMRANLDARFRKEAEEKEKQ